MTRQKCAPRGSSTAASAGHKGSAPPRFCQRHKWGGGICEANDGGVVPRPQYPSGSPAATHLPICALRRKRGGAGASSPLRIFRQGACKPGSVARTVSPRLPLSETVSALAAIPLGQALLRGSSNQPGRSMRNTSAVRPEGLRRAAPIRSCSEWGLPCRDCYQPRGALLPHPFTLT